MTRTLIYNIPGNGNIKALLFDHTIKTYDFLNSEHYNHIKYLKNINQLGRLRYVYPGAHHNRYEYVYLQWAFITELVKQKDNFGLGTQRNFYGKINSCSKHPTTGELLQCLVLLTNIGYSEATFAGNRAWLHSIKNNNELRRTFKQGLPKEAYGIMEEIIESFDFYRFQHLITLFLLQRYRRRDDGEVDFLTNLLIGYIKKEDDSIHKIKLWDLFNNIRKISFLTLDSLYSPVPFSLRLSSIILSFDEYYKDMILKKTGYTQALIELESVLQNSVYLSPESVICTSKSTREILSALEEKKDKFKKISTLKSLILKNLMKNDFESNFINWSINQTITLNYENSSGYLSDSINSPIEWENSFISILKKSKIELGIVPTPNRNLLKVAISIISDDFKSRLGTSLKLVSVFHKINNSFSKDYKNPKELENYREVYDFILKAVFGWHNKFIIDNKDQRYNPIFIESGKAKMISAINNYYKKVEHSLNADDLFEITQLKNAVNKYGYSGLMLGYVGATKVLSTGKNNLSAEFDGVLILPNKSIDENFMFVIEAKNLNNGFTQAHKQLQQRIPKVLSTKIYHEIKKLNSNTAVTEMRSK